MDTLLAPGIWQIDTLLGGFEKVNATFLVEGDRPCLVETGPQRDAAQVLAALARHQMGAQDLAWIVVSHIHLDHAGAVGEMAANFPRASVVCHPKGARHLADPTRLIAASAEVYGERLDTLYGRMTPVPLDRLMAAEDGLVLELGAGRSLLLVHSPGHAKHHLGILEQSSGTLLVGDAVGVKLPGSGPLRPATPPNDFDLELAVHSLHHFRELRPTQLVLTHFGPVGEPEAVLVEAEDALQSWAAVASEAFAERPEVDHIERALRARFASSAEPPGPTQTAQDILSGFRSNAEGMFGWLRRQRESRAQVEEGGATAPQ